MKRTIPPRTMRELRLALPPATSAIRNYRTQGDAAALIGVSKRTVARWELEGAPILTGWCYVGVAYRVGRADAAQDMLQRFAQLGLPGSDLWGRADA